MLGNRLDKLNHFANLIRCIGQFGEDRRRVIGFVGASLRDVRASADLGGDFVNRRCQLLGSRCDGFNVGCSLFGCGRNICGLTRCLIRLGGHAGRGATQLVDSGVNHGQVTFNVLFKLRNAGINLLGACQLCGVCSFLFFLQTVGFFPVFAEYFECAGKITNLVLAICRIAFDRCITICKVRKCFGDAAQRGRCAAFDGKGQATNNGHDHHKRDKIHRCDIPKGCFHIIGIDAGGNDQVPALHEFGICQLRFVVVGVWMRPHIRNKPLAGLNGNGAKFCDRCCAGRVLD